MHASYFANIAQYDYLAYPPIDDQIAWESLILGWWHFKHNRIDRQRGQYRHNRISLFHGWLRIYLFVR
jgi:hypothetical protein